MVSAIKWVARSIWKFLCYLFSILSSKEVIAAFIGALVLIWGYTLTVQSQQQQEKYQSKETAYDAFLNQLELNFQPIAAEKFESTSSFYSQVEKQNAAFAVLEANAPSCVVQEIENEVFNSGTGSTIGAVQVQTLELILHNDLNGEGCTSSPSLATSSFMFFYFNRI